MELIIIGGAIIASMTVSAIIAHIVVTNELKHFQESFLNVLKDTTLEAVRLGLNKCE